jgi:hypothetical protein
MKPDFIGVWRTLRITEGAFHFAARVHHRGRQSFLALVMRGEVMRRHIVAALLAVAALAGVAVAEDPVYLADANLKAAVETALGKSNPTPHRHAGIDRT